MGDIWRLAYDIACLVFVARAGYRQKTLRLTEVPMKQPQFSRDLGRCFLFFVLAAAAAGAQELPNLPPISPEELAMKDNPADPGEAAIMLYYAVDTDNTKSTETRSVRIKVFRDEGKKYADIEVPYYGTNTHVEEIRARTVGPEGKAEEFAGQILEREIVKAKKYRVNAKVLTLLNVQVGTVIEYSYRLHFKENIPELFRHPSEYLIKSGYAYPAAEWIVQQDLFLRHGHFTLHGVKGAEIREHSVAMPKDVNTRRLSDGSMEMDIVDVPAYEEEGYSPPEENLRTRIDLYYAVGFYTAEYYWKDVAKRRAEHIDSFVKKSKAIEREAAQLSSPGDTQEAKLRKIYARVQQIRAVGFEASKTEKERKQENLKENKSSEDVLNRGYAFGNEINLVFVALARAAGFEAYPVLVTSRRGAFFLKDLPNEGQLNSMVVAVRLDKSTLFLDPATRFCPFGLLPWDETDAGGIRVSSFGPGTGFTPLSKSTDAVTRWEAELRLNEDGSLRGKVKALYFGQEALSKRLYAIQEDEAERRKELEESVKNGLAQGATVRLLGVEGWETSEGPLKVDFEVEVPNFATQAGRRWVLPLGIFHVNEKNPFPSARRAHDIYFSYPQESYEVVKLELPPGMQAESLPADVKADQGGAYYEFSTKKEGNTVRMTRALRLSVYYIKQEQYPL